MFDNLHIMNIRIYYFTFIVSNYENRILHDTRNHRRRTGGASGAQAPLDSKMAHRRNAKFRAEPPLRTPKLSIYFGKFGALARNTG